MITIGDTPSKLGLVQIIPGLTSVIEDGEPDDGFDVAQWEPTSDYFCEFQDQGDCDSGTVSWGTSDEYEPKLCTKHYFSYNSGYELIQSAA